MTVTEEMPLFPNPESLAVPDTVIGLLVTVALLAGLLITTLGPVVSGVAAAWVVTAKVPATPPIVSVTVVVVLNAPEEVWRTATVWPGLSVPAVVTKAPPLML